MSFLFTSFFFLFLLLLFSLAFTSLLLVYLFNRTIFGVFLNWFLYQGLNSGSFFHDMILVAGQKEIVVNNANFGKRVPRVLKYSVPEWNTLKCCENSFTPFRWISRLVRVRSWSARVLGNKLTAISLCRRYRSHWLPILWGLITHLSY